MPYNKKQKAIKAPCNLYKNAEPFSIKILNERWEEIKFGKTTLLNSSQLNLSIKEEFDKLKKG